MTRGGAHRDPDPVLMKLPGPSCLKFLLNSEKFCSSSTFTRWRLKNWAEKPQNVTEKIFSVQKFIANSAMIQRSSTSGCVFCVIL